MTRAFQRYFLDHNAFLGDCKAYIMSDVEQTIRTAVLLDCDIWSYQSHKKLKYAEKKLGLTLLYDHFQFPCIFILCLQLPSALSQLINIKAQSLVSISTIRLCAEHVYTIGCAQSTETESVQSTETESAQSTETEKEHLIFMSTDEADWLFSFLRFFFLFFFKFCPNLLNGGIDEDRAPAKQSLLRWPCPLPSYPAIPVLWQNLESNV